MTTNELQRFQRRLLELKKRLGGALSALEEEALHPLSGEAAGGLSNAPIHSADLGNEVYEEEVALDLVANEDQILTEVNDALARIEAGTFGRCEGCGQAIGKARLEALPYTRYCIQHARQRERQGKT